MIAWDIAGGVLIGALLGVINIYLLRLSVRRALGFQRGWRAVAMIIGTYAARYLAIGLVIIGLLKIEKVAMALTVLTVLATLTVVLAMVQRQQKGRTQKSEVGSAEKLHEFRLSLGCGRINRKRGCEK